MLSDGRDVQLYKGVVCGALFQKMDATGANVLFFTADPVLPEDTDGVQEDIYDARINGGIVPPSAAGLCNGSSCEEDLPQGPIAIAPASTSESGEAGVSPVSTLVVKNKPAKRKSGKRKAHMRKRKARKSRAHTGGRRPRPTGEAG